MSLFTRLVLLYLCIAIACSMFRPDLVFGGSQQGNTVLGFFNINSTDNPDRSIWEQEPNVTINGQNSLTGLNWNESMSKQTQLTKTGCEGVLCGIQNFVDGLLNAMGYVKLFLNAVFSPFYILAALGIPTVVLLIFGIPLIFMFFISIVMFVRGYP